MKIGEIWISKNCEEGNFKVKILEIIRYEKYIMEYKKQVELLEAIFDTKGQSPKAKVHDDFIKYQCIFDYPVISTIPRQWFVEHFEKFK